MDPNRNLNKNYLLAFFTSNSYFLASKSDQITYSCNNNTSYTLLNEIKTSKNRPNSSGSLQIQMSR